MHDRSLSTLAPISKKMSSIVDEVVRMPLDEDTVVGRLYSDQQGWSFSSSEAAFLEIFSAGAVHSGRDYGIGTIGKRANAFKRNIEKELEKRHQARTS